MTLLLRLAAIATLCIAGAAQADDYPSRPVRVIVGFTAGAAADITARVLASGRSGCAVI